MNWSSDENIERVYRLLRIKGFGPVQVNKLLYKSQGQVQSPSDFEQYIFHALTKHESEEYKRDIELYRSSRFSVHYASILDEGVYPSSLRNVLSQRAPSVLSYIGNIELLKKKKIAFSGSRKASEKGLWITRDCVKQLATDKDVCIVSAISRFIRNCNLFGIWIECWLLVNFFPMISGWKVELCSAIKQLLVYAMLS